MTALKRPSAGLLQTTDKGRSTRVSASATRSRPKWPQTCLCRPACSAGHCAGRWQTGKLGDKGYQSQAHPQIISPHKKPKGGELTSEQRLENRQTCLCVARLPARSAQAGRQVAQQRIYVEHSIRRIKGWRILREDYRLGVGLFPMIAGAVVGLVQLDRILGPACADLPAAQGTAQAGGRQVNDKENRIEGRDRLIFYSSDHLLVKVRIPSLSSTE